MRPPLLGDWKRIVVDEELVAGVLETVHTRLSDAALDRLKMMAFGRLKRLAETDT